MTSAARRAPAVAPRPVRGHALRALLAQVATETRSRLRSTGTIFTMLLLFAVAFTYVPPPGAHRVSIMWHSGGHNYTGTYTASFIGAVVAMLTGMLLPLVGFYLVTGSVRRDLERRVWPIIAATRTSASSYLVGKWLAGFAYLLVLGALALLPAGFLFLRYGSGPFAPGQLLLPWLLIVPPAMAFTAALALLFDVTPGLRGRGGYVLAFFAWAILMLVVPGQLAGIDEKPRNERLVGYDPAGAVLFDRLIARSATTPVEAVSVGLIFTDMKLERVPFAPLRISSEMVRTRLVSAAWTLAPLLAALAIFRLTAGRGARPPRQRRQRLARATPSPPWQPAAARTFHAHGGRPGLARAIVAEALLVWQSASWIKWLLLLAAASALVVPGDGVIGPVAVFLLLLAPVIGEAAAREELAGTGATVFAQPGVPRSAVAWKLAAIGLFVLALGAPLLLRSSLRGGACGLGMLLALLFVAGAATGLGWLSRGGKLFLGLFTALWYLAIQHDSPLDFTGAFSTRPDLARCAAFAAIGIGTAVLAALVERTREARG